MEITFSAFNNPNVWYEPDTGVIHFASEEDAKRAKELFDKIQAQAARPEVERKEMPPFDVGILQSGLLAMLRGKGMSEAARHVQLYIDNWGTDKVREPQSYSACSHCGTTDKICKWVGDNFKPAPCKVYLSAHDAASSERKEK